MECTHFHCLETYALHVAVGGYDDLADKRMVVEESKPLSTSAHFFCSTVVALDQDSDEIDHDQPFPSPSLQTTPTPCIFCTIRSVYAYDYCDTIPAFKLPETSCSYPQPTEPHTQSIEPKISF